MITAFRTIYEIIYNIPEHDNLPKQSYEINVTMEEFVKFIQDNFCRGERDILVAMLLALELKDNP
jgi:hypothetical protein